MTDTAIPTPADGHRDGWAAALRDRWVLALLGLLLVQLLLAAVLAGTGARRLAPAASDQALLPLAVDALTAVEIKAGNETLRLTRSDAGWVLPDLSNFPASATRVEQLLTDLKALKRPLPVATTAAAHRRFKVTDQAPERVLTLRERDGRSATLLLGDAQGFRRVFARLAGEDAVYDLRLGLTDLTTRADDWIDRGLLRLDRSRIERVAGPGWTLVKAGDGWTLEGSEAKPDAPAVDALLNALAGLGYSGVIGTEAPAGWQPTFTVSVGLAGGEGRRLDFGPLPEGEEFAVKADQQPWVFRAGSFDLGGLLEVTADRLLGKAAPAAEGGAAAGGEADVGAGVDAGDGADAGTGAGADSGDGRDAVPVDQVDGAAGASAAASPGDGAAAAAGGAPAPEIGTGADGDAPAAVEAAGDGGAETGTDSAPR